MQTPPPSSSCPCGSGRKFKKCCQPISGVEKNLRDEEKRLLVRRAEGTSLETLLIRAAELGGEDFFDSASATYACGFEDVVFPEDMLTDPSNVSMYCFHIYSVFKFPYEVLDNGKPNTITQYMIENESSFFRKDQLQFLKAVVSEEYRWLFVSDISENAYVKLTDVESGEVFTVRDLGLSSSGVLGMILLGLVFKMWGEHYLLGAFPRSLPGDWAGQLISLKQKTRQELIDIPPLEGAKKLGECLLADHIQRSNFYHSIKAYSEVHKSPVITNTDGDLMEPRVIEYSLDIEPLEASQKILTASKQFKLRQEEEQENSGFELVWYGNKPKRDSTGELYLRGTVIITDSKIEVHVNSINRANKLCKLIEKILKQDVEFTSEREEKIGKISTNSNFEEPPPEIAELIQQKINSHYQNWLDENIPALAGMTPRNAAKDPKMKPALEALLLEFERRSSALSAITAGPDVNLLRAQLFKEYEQ